MSLGLNAVLPEEMFKPLDTELGVISKSGTSEIHLNQKTPPFKPQSRSQRVLDT